MFPGGSELRLVTHLSSGGFKTTILDKTVEKIIYLDSIFLNIVAVPVLPSSPFPESNVVVSSQESLIPRCFGEATLNWGKGFPFRKGVVFGNSFVA